MSNLGNVRRHSQDYSSLRQQPQSVQRTNSIRKLVTAKIKQKAGKTNPEKAGMTDPQTKNLQLEEEKGKSQN